MAPVGILCPVEDCESKELFPPRALMLYLSEVHFPAEELLVDTPPLLPPLPPSPNAPFAQ
jgi:hypothetical protein